MWYVWFHTLTYRQHSSPFLLGCLVPFAQSVLPSPPLYDTGRCLNAVCLFSPHTWAATVDMYPFLFTLACVHAWRGQATLQWHSTSLSLLSRYSMLMLTLKLLPHLLCAGHRCAVQTIQGLWRTFFGMPGPCAHWVVTCSGRDVECGVCMGMDVMTSVVLADVYCRAYWWTWHTGSLFCPLKVCDHPPSPCLLPHLHLAFVVASISQVASSLRPHAMPALQLSPHESLYISLRGPIWCIYEPHRHGTTWVPLAQMRWVSSLYVACWYMDKDTSNSQCWPLRAMQTWYVPPAHWYIVD